MDDDLLGNALFIGVRCLHLQAGTQTRVALVEVLEIKETGIVCKVISKNATRDKCRGSFWEDGYVTRPLSPTNLIVYNN